MRTAYCPKSHTELASESAGKEYGHVPGHQYHDVDVVISHRTGKYRVHVVESWGSAQGHDEEHGRREAIGRGDSINEACRDAEGRAKQAGIESEYLAQAMSLAEDTASEKEVRAEMSVKTTHFTNFGVSMQPSVADQEGYLEYRDGFESLDRDEWTRAEEWIRSQEERIREFQSRG